jgi:hypothetical protein
MSGIDVLWYHVMFWYHEMLSRMPTYMLPTHTEQDNGYSFLKYLYFRSYFYMFHSGDHGC